MASHPFSLSVLPIQQALAHFREKKTEAGKGSNFPEATQLTRVEKTQDLSQDLCWVLGGLTSNTASGSSVAGGTEMAGSEACCRVCFQNAIIYHGMVCPQVSVCPSVSSLRHWLVPKPAGLRP